MTTIDVAMESTSQEILSAVQNSGGSNYAVPSSTVIGRILNTEKSHNNTTWLNCANGIIANFSGIVRVNMSIKCANASYPAQLACYKNGDTTGGYAGTVSTVSTSYTTLSLDIPVHDGDVLSFFLRGSASSQRAYCNLITVCGTISQTQGAASVTALS